MAERLLSVCSATTFSSPHSSIEGGAAILAIAVVTWMLFWMRRQGRALKGELEHKDSMGNGRIIRAGEVQYMAAGTGVRHSEFNPSATEEVHLLQIWIQPDRQGVQPRYADRALRKETGNLLELIASRAGRDGSFAIHQDADLWLGRFEPGTHALHPLAPGRHAWVHVAEGEILLDGVRLASGDAAGVSEQSQLEILAEKASQVLLFDLN